MFKNITKNLQQFRLISSCSIKYNKSQHENLKNFTPVYRLPQIRVLSLVNRLKLYHTILTGAAIPGTLILNQFNLINVECVWITSALGVSGGITLYSLGYLCQKFIGFVYLSKDEKVVRMACSDFWGNRIDEEMLLNDIIPLANNSEGMFLKCHRFSTKTVMRMNLKYGHILDEEKFNKIFSQ